MRTAHWIQARHMAEQHSQRKRLCEPRSLMAMNPALTLTQLNPNPDHNRTKVFDGDVATGLDEDSFGLGRGDRVQRISDAHFTGSADRAVVVGMYMDYQLAMHDAKYEAIKPDPNDEMYRYRMSEWEEDWGHFRWVLEQQKKSALRKLASGDASHGDSGDSNEDSEGSENGEAPGSVDEGGKGDDSGGGSSDLRARSQQQGCCICS